MAKDVHDDRSEGIFDRGVPSDGSGDGSLRCGYVEITLPTSTPGVAAGDLMKPLLSLKSSNYDHEYEMPDFDERRVLGGMAPRLIQNNGKNVEFTGDDEMNGTDEEWNPQAADKDTNEKQKPSIPRVPAT